MKKLLFKFESVEAANEFDNAGHNEYRFSERLSASMGGFVFIRRAHVVKK